MQKSKKKESCPRNQCKQLLPQVTSRLFGIPTSSFLLLFHVNGVTNEGKLRRKKPGVAVHYTVHPNRIEDWGIFRYEIDIYVEGFLYS